MAYSKDKYDIERFEQLRSISIEIINEYTGIDENKIRELFANESGYPTPKVDIRGVVFRDRRILMVKEQIDGKWALPGGWADIGLSPKEVAVKEIKEESGFDVIPVRLLGIVDKKFHKHPPSALHVYKIFILCEIIGGEAETGIETSQVEFFNQDNLPELSVERNTEEQIQALFELIENPDKEIMFD